MSDMKDGQSAGIACLSKIYRGLGITKKDGVNWIYIEEGGKRSEIAPIAENVVFLRGDFDVPDNQHRLSYSLDGENYIQAGEEFEMRWGDWKGPRVGVYSYGADGTAHFDDFEYVYQ